MSKERKQRREAREREAAIKTAARAAEQERRARAQARRRAVTRWLPTSAAPGARRPVGVRAQRARRRTAGLVVLLVALNALLWFAVPDWPVRALAAIVSVLVAPVLYTLAFRQRR